MPKPNRCTKRLWRFARRSLAASIPIRQQASTIWRRFIGKWATMPKPNRCIKEALEIRQKVLGREHPDTATSLNNLAVLYRDMGDYAKAEPLLKEALEIRQKVLGHEHPFTATSLNNLALLYASNGRLHQSRTAVQRSSGDSPKGPWPGPSRYGDKPEQSGDLGVGLRKDSGSQTTRPTWVRCRPQSVFPNPFVRLRGPATRLPAALRSLHALCRAR